MTRLTIRLVSRLSLGCVGLALLMLGIGRTLFLPNNELVYAAYLKPGHNVIYRMDIAHQLTHPITSETLNVFNSDPVWSPDGQHIAFVSVDESSQTAIYVMDKWGGGLQPLQDASLSDFSPTWSPDGQYIAFVRRYTISPELMLMDMQSGLTRRLTNNYGNENNPTWSPDNHYVTFEGQASDIRNIYNLDVQTGDIRLLVATPVDVDFPAWSPDGRYLLYIAGGRKSGIYLWDTVQMQSILLDLATFTPTDAPNWSPDGRFIVYSAFINLKTTGIFQLDVADCLQKPDACTPQLLTHLPGYYQSPRWRPASP